MRNYLRLRLRVLGRQVWELGWWRLTLLGALFVLTGARALLTAAASPTLVWAVPLGAALGAFQLHRQREDLAFLWLTAPGFRRWLLIEYALFSAPLVLPLLAFGQVEAALLTTGLLAAVGWLAPMPAAPASRQRWASWCRSVAFEWVSSLRQLWLGLGWLGLLSAALATRHTSTGPALAVVGWLLLTAEVYGPAEPWTWLLPVLRRPGPWLRSRVGWGLLYFGLTGAPLAAVLLLGPAGAGGLLVLGWCALVLVMLILAKYAFYPHATLGRLAQAGVLMISVSVLGSNPAYGALFVACFLGLLIKSQRRLAAYSHD